MKFQRIIISDDGKSAEIQCPSCLKKKNVPIEKVPQKFWFIVKCSCGSEFVMQHELRSRFRKNVHLTGVVMKRGAQQNSKWGKTLNASIGDTSRLNCMIINISTIGVGVFLTGRAQTGKIRVGDVLLVRFNLDNSASTKIEKMVTVKAVKNNYIGCEFFNNEKEDKNVKFYLL